jgi:transposase
MEVGMARFDLTDFEWSVIEPLLPNKSRGGPRVDDRRVLNGIFWRLRTGRTLGRHSRALRSAHDLREPLNRWRKAGVWDRLVAAVSKVYDGDIQMIDSSSIRVHQHAANAQKKTPDPVAWAKGPKVPTMDRWNGPGGRSRGGLTTKIHALVDAEGLPIALKLTEGQAHDGKNAGDMLDALVEGQILLADRAYDSDALRQELAERRPLPTSSPCRTARMSRRSAPTSTDTEISSSASSTKSSTTAPLRRATTSDRKTSSPE